MIFAHGYRDDGPDIFITDSPIRDYLIAHGSAWAASSYRGNGYRPEGTDNRLVQRAIRRAGHCNFTTDERTRAFADIVAWMESSVPPDGDVVRQDVFAILGLSWTDPLEPDDPSLPARAG